MSKVQKSPVKASSRKRVELVPQLRDRALREVKHNYAHVFHDAQLHKRICQFLFAAYLTAPVLESVLALEFYRVYKHFAEGGSVLDFPYKCVDKTDTIRQLRKILRGDSVYLATTDEEDDDDE